MKNNPLRMCICCRKMLPKKDLLRVVEYDGVYSIDSTNKSNGRGAYICKSKECIDKVCKTYQLNKAFKSNIPVEIYSSLKEMNFDEFTD